jgi:hypothetical protein
MEDIFLDSNLKKKYKEIAFDTDNPAHKRELNKILRKRFDMDFESYYYKLIFDCLKNDHPGLEFKLMIVKK